MLHGTSWVKPCAASVHARVAGPLGCLLPPKIGLEFASMRKLKEVLRLLRTMMTTSTPELDPKPPATPEPPQGASEGRLQGARPIAYEVLCLRSGH